LLEFENWKLAGITRYFTLRILVAWASLTTRIAWYLWANG